MIFSGFTSRETHQGKIERVSRHPLEWDEEAERSRTRQGKVLIVMKHESDLVG